MEWSFRVETWKFVWTTRRKQSEKSDGGEVVCLKGEGEEEERDDSFYKSYKSNIDKIL
jgi:hypothetical protein